MYVITPYTLTDSTFSSSIAEPDTGESIWNAATSYTVGQRVIRTTTHRVYENLVAGVDATLPENATAGTTPRWLDVSATNRWALLDEYVNSQSTALGSITLDLDVGSITAIGLLNTQATNVNVKVYRDWNGSSGTLQYDQTKYLNTGAGSWYDVFFNTPSSVSQITFGDIPLCPKQHVRVTAYGDQVAIGILVAGSMFDFGATPLQGVSAGIVDYSRKETDGFGRTTLVRRANARKSDVRLLIENTQLPTVYQKLSSLTATPALWVGSELSSYQPLVIYGTFEDFDVAISYPNHTMLTLRLKGLV